MGLYTALSVAGPGGDRGGALPGRAHGRGPPRPLRARGGTAPAISSTEMGKLRCWATGVAARNVRYAVRASSVRSGPFHCAGSLSAVRSGAGLRYSSWVALQSWAMTSLLLSRHAQLAAGARPLAQMGAPNARQ
jgi:hypothetical protein